ncbi:hypothetical protein GYH30_050489 [Glycine max]|nr:hypothetical protein GYH30_050489 [Glycine max]
MCRSELRALENLDLTANMLNDSILRAQHLQSLNLSSNLLEGSFNISVGFSGNNFAGNIGSNLASLTSLDYLGFERNQFEVPISFAPFSNHSNLKFISNGNKLQVLSLSSRVETNSLPLPIFLHYHYNLTYLDFTGCKLGGEYSSVESFFRHLPAIYKPSSPR